MLHILVFNVALIAVAAFALWGGGAPERWVAGLMVAANAATALLPYDPASTFHSLDWSGFGVDAVLFAAFTAVALRANRYWPIWLAALQMVSVAIHVIRIVDRALVPLVYAWSIGQIAYPLMALLVAGTIRHRRRCREFGHDPAWNVDIHRRPVDPVA
ncbi:hypothetical protein KCP91_08890 [Microvirga sp. SRT01]|uniref:Rod shape-determining protein MreD n=1 Tax=Sphingomonas longa TaxID=2778730 RepID=A0ABS2D6E2_9SPHN|nr:MULTISPECIES: hypothetical protein [Alphaproteobacteria]MBM6576489.1 hypothetical protein [Sphingomonas sp. BT552]MBR7709535.1 hypothetical protein [Microvirga sp. SRT01]